MNEAYEEISLEHLKSMTFDELNQLAEELRQTLIENVARTGGHLASNLGTVELTIALHKVFDSPRDKIVWDVGHQAYIHKMLTGRLSAFDTLRQLDGLAGFPKRRESVHDTFDSGHSGDSISAALGYAKARDLAGEDHACIAVIGDGAMTGGVAFEALNAAGASKRPFIVVLNDNAMSISPNVGGLSNHLQKVRTSVRYQKFKSRLKNVFGNNPKMMQKLSAVRDALKYALLPGEFFEELGFKYFGPVDGHDIESMCYFFEAAKSLNKPVLIHCVTKKGKGFAPAEENPEKYHGIGPFDPSTADSKFSRNPNSWSEIFGKLLLERAKKDPKICAVTAAMIEGTGLSCFREALPDRIIDAGIAEQHAVSFAAGLALGGYKPVFAVYSTFLQRAYDQVITEICLQNLPVIFAVDRAGAVGADGETHQGLYDIEFLASMPGMTILSPRDGAELEKMLDYALALNGPAAIRYPRGTAPADLGLPAVANNNAAYVPAPQCLCDGMDVVFLSDGASLPHVLQAARMLEEKRISCAVWDLKQLKPLPEHFLSYAFGHWHNMVVVEDGDVCCGVGTRIAAKADSGCKVLCLGWPDAFVEQGTQAQLRQRYGIDAAGIACRTEKFLENKA